MRVLLGSGGFRTPERIAFLRERMQACFGSITELLFIPHALKDHDAYVATMQQRGLDAGYRLVGLHTLPDPITAIDRAEGLFVGGGNTFRLLAELYRMNLLGPIKRRVRAGVPYLGVSAGCNVACPTIKTTNDMPITQPPSLDALGLVPFQVNAHYFSGHHFVRDGDTLVEHFGETRDERLKEFHEMNSMAVVGLPEGGTLWCENGSIRLEGTSARVILPGQSPMDVPAGENLTGMLTPISYSVFVTLPEGMASDWLTWMRKKHLTDVVAAGALSGEVVQMESGEFEARYRFASRAAFAVYERDHAPRLRAEGLALFPIEKGVKYRRTLGTLRG